MLLNIFTPFIQVVHAAEYTPLDYIGRTGETLPNPLDTYMALYDLKRQRTASHAPMIDQASAYRPNPSDTIGLVPPAFIRIQSDLGNINALRNGLEVLASSNVRSSLEVMDEASTILPNWFNDAETPKSKIANPKSILPNWFNGAEPSSKVRSSLEVMPADAMPADAIIVDQPFASDAVLPAWYDQNETVDETDSVLPNWFERADVPLPDDYHEPAMPIQPFAEPLERYFSAPIPQLSISVDAPDVSLGDEAVGGDWYTVTVKNGSGATIAQNVVLTINIPATGFSFVEHVSLYTNSVNFVPVAPTINGNQVTWSPVISLHPNKSLQLAFKLSTNGSAYSGQRLEAAINYENPTGTDETLVAGQNVQVGRGNLEIRKTPKIQNGTYGDVITWNVEVANTGLGSVYSVTVADTPGAGYTSEDLNEIAASTPFHLSIGQRANFGVTATINSCVNLTNTAQAYWEYGNEENTGTSSNPVQDSTDVAYLLNNPDISISANPVVFDYCSTNPQTVTVTITNAAGAGPAFSFTMKSTVLAGTNLAVGDITAGWIYKDGEFSASDIILGGNTTVFSFTLTPPTAMCGTEPAGDFAFKTNFTDACELPYIGPDVSVPYSYNSENAPTLDVSKTATWSSGSDVKFEVYLTATNTVTGITGDIVVTDDMPATFDFDINNISSDLTGDNFSIDNDDIIWTIPASLGPTINGKLTIDATNNDSFGTCAADAYVNKVEATAQPSCPECNTLTASADSNDVVPPIRQPELEMKINDLEFNYCANSTRTVFITMTNTSNYTAKNVVLDMTQNGSTLFVPATQPHVGSINPALLTVDVSNVGSNWDYESSGEIFTLKSGVIGPKKEVVTLTFDVAPQNDVCGNAAHWQAMFDVAYKDICDVAQTGLITVNAPYNETDIPRFGIDKVSATTEVTAGDVFSFTIDFKTINAHSLSGTLQLEDTVPEAFTILDYSGKATLDDKTLYTITGTDVTHGGITDSTIISAATNKLTWKIPITDLGKAYTLTGKLVITVQATDVTANCGANSTYTNKAEGEATPNCSSCVPMKTNGSADVSITPKTGDPASSSGQASGSDGQVCGNIQINNTYARVFVTNWSDVVFTETLGSEDSIPAESLNYVADSLQVSISGTDVTTYVVISQTAPTLIVGFAEVVPPTATVGTRDILISYSLYISDAILANNPTFSGQTKSYLSVSNVGNTGVCGSGDNAYFEQTIPITAERADLKMSLTPETFVGCKPTQVTLTVSDDNLIDNGLVANNIVVTMTVDSAEFGSIDTSQIEYGGGFADNSPTKTVDMGNNVVTWEFTKPLTHNNSTTGSIVFTMTRGCGVANLSAGVSFDNRCGISYGDSASNSADVITPDIRLFVTPDSYVIDQSEVHWRVYATNVGAGTAGRFVITNLLGSGIRFITYTTSLSDQIALTDTKSTYNKGEDIAWEVSNLGQGEQIRLDITANVESCSNVTSTIKVDSSCLGNSCASADEESINFSQLPTAIRSENDQTADLPLCDIGGVKLRVKNAGLEANITNMIITETISFMNYVTGSSFITVYDKSGNVVTDLHSVPFEPQITISGTDRLLVWSLDVATKTYQTATLKLRGPEETIEIEFNVSTDCTVGDVNKVKATVGGIKPCGDFFIRAESAETLDTTEPSITLQKGGRNVTIGDTKYTSDVYGEPGDIIEWQVWAVNATGYFTAKNVIVTDTLPTVVAYTGSYSNYGISISQTGQVVTWTVGNMASDGDDKFLYITSTIRDNETCNDASKNTALLWYGCDSGCQISPPLSAIATLHQKVDVSLKVPADTVLNVCGGDISFNLVNTNGPVAHDVIVTDTLPTGYEFVTGTVTGVSTSSLVTEPVKGDIKLLWGWDVLSRGTTIVSFTVRQTTTNELCTINTSADNLLDLEYRNKKTCFDDKTFTDTQKYELTFQKPDVQIAKTPNYQVGAIGEVVSWTISLTNVGDGIANEVIVTDTAGSQYEKITPIDNQLVQVAETTTTVTISTTTISTTVSTNTTTIPLGTIKAFTSSTIITWPISLITGVSSIAKKKTVKKSGDVTKTTVNTKTSYYWTATVQAILTETGDNRNLAEVRTACDTGCRTDHASSGAYASLLNVFSKTNRVYTGTVGDLLIYDVLTTLSDNNGKYLTVTLQDDLPYGLGFVSSEITYTVDSDEASTKKTLVSRTTTISPGLYKTGPVVWSLGNLTGSVEIKGQIVVVVRDVLTNTEGSTLTNHLQINYNQDGGDFVFTDTADAVTLQEPIIHLGERYITTHGDESQLWLENYNDDEATGVEAITSSNWAVIDGVYRNNSADADQRAFFGDKDWTDYSYSFMVRSSDTTGTIGAYIRQDDTGTANTGYRLEWTTSGLSLVNATTGASIISNSTAYNPNQWHHVELRTVGDLIQIYIDGELELETNDSTFTQGRVGLYSDNNQGTQFDDVLVTRIGDMSHYVGANDLVTYTIFISNQGQLPGYNLVITDIMPDGLTLYTYTVTSDDADAKLTGSKPDKGDTGTLIWHVNQLTNTNPFSPLSHVGLTITLVMTVNDNITANTVLMNQSFLSYKSYADGTAPTSINRVYDGGQHSNAIQTIDGEPEKIMSIDSAQNSKISGTNLATATIGAYITYTIIMPKYPITATFYDFTLTDTFDSRLSIIDVMTKDLSSFGNLTGLSGNQLVVTFDIITHATQAYITITTRVSNAAAISQGAVITNVASMSHATSDEETISQTNVVTVNIIEPILHIAERYELADGRSSGLLTENFNDNSAGVITPSGTWVVNNNTYINTDATGVHTATFGDGTWTDTSTSFMMKSPVSSTGTIGGFIRGDGTTSGYLFEWDETNGMQLVDAATGNSIATRYNHSTITTNAGFTPDEWYHVEMTAVGDQIQVYVNNELVLSATDSTYTSGTSGFYSENNDNSTFDDLHVTRLGDMSHYVGANDLITYSMFISNQGMLPAYDLVVTDSIPSGLRVVGYQIISDDTTINVTQAPSVGDDGELVWNFSHLTPTVPFVTDKHTGIEIILTLQVADSITANSYLQNQSKLVYNSLPQGAGATSYIRSYEGGSHSDAVRTVNGGITKTVTFSPQPTATLGTLVTYTLIAPLSPISATMYNVVITDQLNTPLFLIEAVTTTGGYNPTVISNTNTGLIQVNFDSISHSVQAYITVTARISHEFPATGDPNSGDLITNSATMSHTTAPLVTSTNVVTTEVGEPRLVVAKTGAVNTANPNSMFYTVTVTNTGNSVAYGPLNIQDAIPTGFTVTNISDSGELLTSSHRISWTIADLGVGSAISLTYLATLTETIYTQNSFTNTVVVTNTSLTDTILGVRPYVTTTTHTIYPLGRIGNYVWYDLEWEGSQITGTNIPISNVVVDLYNTDTGTFITQTTTDGSGEYYFENLPLGVTYTVQISSVNFGASGVLSQYGPTLLNSTAATTDSDASKTAMFTNSSGVLAGYAVTTTLTAVVTEDLSLDFGFVELVEIGNYVWFDIDQDGQQNDTVANGRDGVTITVTYPDGRVFTTTTSHNGYYTFTVPISQVYTITLAADNFDAGGPLEGMSQAPQNIGIDTSDSDSATVGGALVITMTSLITQNDYTFDFGLIIAVEPTIVKGVSFTPSPTATLGTTVTYVITVPQPDITRTLRDALVTDVVDSRLRIITVSAPSGVSDISGQTVSVTYSTLAANIQRFITITAIMSNGLNAVMDDLLTNTATLAYSTVNGTAYTSTNVVTTKVGEPRLVIAKTGAVVNGSPRSADYTVTVTNTGTSVAFGPLVITDYIPSAMTASNISDSGAVLSNGRTISWTIPSLAVNAVEQLTYRLTMSEPIYTVGTFTNTVMITNSSLTGTIPGIREYITDTVFTLTWPLGRIGNYVWYDFPRDGKQGTDSNEFSIPNVLVDLYDATTGDYITSTLTDGTGHYTFENLPLDVSYTVMLSTSNFATGAPLNGLSATVLESTTATTKTDSNASKNDTFTARDGSISGYAITTTLTQAFTEDLSLDYGFVKMVTIGDTVWFDVDQNGTRNEALATKGQSGVTITITYPDGRVFTTTTDLNSGYYSFSVPISQVYTITLIPENFAPGGPLANYTPTSPNEGADDSKDSDGIGNRNIGMTITMTSIVTQDDMTFDFGVVWDIEPTIVKGVSFTPSPTATLGTTVTYVITVPDPGITRTLRDAVITDMVDSRLDVINIEASNSGDTTASSGSSIDVRYDKISQNQQRFITITAIMSDGLKAVMDDLLTNTATLAYSTVNGTAYTSTNVVTTKVGEPRLVVAKTGAVSTADPQTVNYTVTVTNTGNAIAYGPLLIQDYAPADVSINSITPNGAVLTDGRTISWTLSGPLAVNGSFQLNYNLTITEPIYTSDQFVNTAMITNTSLTKTIPGVRQYVTNTVFTLTWPLGRIGNYVWYDFDYDGVQDYNADEFPFVGVVVDLYNADTGVYITSTSTNASGNYYFENLPLGVTYTVQLSETNFNVGHVLDIYSPTLVAASVTMAVSDSNASPTQTFKNMADNQFGYAITTSLTAIVTEDLTLDYGFARLVEIGDTVWFDVNQNGIQDENMAVYGQSGVTITVTYGDGRAFTTTTIANGIYTFSVPISNAFTVTVLAENFAPGGPLEIYTNTYQNEGSDKTADSNGKPDPAGLIIYTGPVTTNTFTFDFGLLLDITPSIAKSTSFEPLPDATLGTTVTYIITVPQTSITRTLDNVYVTDTIDNRLEIVDLVAPNSDSTSINRSNGRIEVSYSQIAANEQHFITITSIISDPRKAVAGNEIPNVATLRYDSVSVSGAVITQTNTVTTSVLEPELTLDKSSNPISGTVISKKDVINYRILITNSNATTVSTAYGLIVTDTIPTGMRKGTPILNSVSKGGGTVADSNYNFSYVTATGIMVIDFIETFTMPRAAVLQIDYTVTADDNLTDGLILTNIADLIYSSMQNAPLGERVYTDSNDNTFTSNSPLLTITKVADPNPVQAGQLLTYTLSYSLSGGNTAQAVVITDTVPTSSTFVSASPVASVTNKPAVGAMGTVKWSLGDQNLLAGEVTGLVTMVVRVDEPLLTGTILSNFAELASFESYTNTTMTSSVVSTHALLLQKSDSPDPVSTGYGLTYYLDWQVIGNGVAQGVTISDTVPDGTTYGSCSGAPCTQTGGVVSYTLGDQPAGTTGRVQLNVNVHAPVGAIVTNTAFISSTENQTATSIATTGVTIRPANLTIWKSVSPGTTRPDGIVTYRLSAVNWGPSTASNVTIVDTLPDHLTFGGIVRQDHPFVNPPTQQGQKLTWSAGSWPWGILAIIEFTATVDSNYTGTLTNSVTIGSSSLDPDPTNNSGTASLVVTPLGRIGDYVWFEQNPNGIQDNSSDEKPIPGVLLYLYNSNNVVVGTTTTDANGYYIFDLLPLSNTYTVQLASSNFITGGALYTMSNIPLGQGTNVTDNNASPAALYNGKGYAVSTTLTSAFTEDLTLDFGFTTGEGRLGNYVWLEDIPDGLQGTGTEQPIANVVVNLYDDSGNLIGTTKTDANGYYLFDNLPLTKTYTVQLASSNFASGQPLAAYNATAIRQGSNFAQDSNADPNKLYGSSGYAVSTTLTAVLTEDLTLDFGFSQNPGRIGDTVWLEQNPDGVQGTGTEQPLAGVIVNLYNAATGALSATTTTDANGNYLFENLPLDQSYVVQLAPSNFVSSGVLSIYSNVPLGNGTSATDNNANPSDMFNGNGYAVTTTLNLTQVEDLTLDFGFTPPPGSIGDTVWFETVPNGMQGDAGETVLAGVIVNLYDSKTGKLIASVSTDANGNYLFEGLPLGQTYVVQLAPQNFQPGGVLASMSNIPTGQGTANDDNNANPSDMFNGNGSPVGSSGYAVTTTLTTALTENLTLDFG
ncbi:SdrD B-like domain-containing protein, partial [Anaerolineales bacterium HSG6]|nr:SdrD B-like domain-containing protein [Anaerolineales bacterium HSG6]